jgi:hypothetical protein
MRNEDWEACELIARRHPRLYGAVLESSSILSVCYEKRILEGDLTRSLQERRGDDVKRLFKRRLRVWVRMDCSFSLEFMMW